ncbi:MAG: type II secretion system protein M [Pseudomonadales bacterium]|nr:type II secretion system protein M [Pseudomonadales bacterium]
MTSAELKQLARQRWSQLENWYDSREPREQQVLKVLAVVVALVLLYWLVWAPTVNSREQAQRRYVANMQTLRWIESNSAAVRAASASSNGTQLSRNWVSEVSRSADSYGLTLKGFSPDGNRAVRIQMENQPASQTVIWLQSLQEKGVQITTLEMTPGDKSGTATVRATLQQ